MASALLFSPSHPRCTFDFILFFSQLQVHSHFRGSSGSVGPKLTVRQTSLIINLIADSRSFPPSAKSGNPAFFFFSALWTPPLLTETYPFCFGFWRASVRFCQWISNSLFFTWSSCLRFFPPLVRYLSLQGCARAGTLTFSGVGISFPPPPFSSNCIFLWRAWGASLSYTSVYRSFIYPVLQQSLSLVSPFLFFLGFGFRPHNGPPRGFLAESCPLLFSGRQARSTFSRSAFLRF